MNTKTKIILTAVFIGIRDGKAFAIETNVETFKSDVILKTNVDKNSLKK